MSPRTIKKETEVVSVRMPSVLKKRLQDLARQKHRSLNGQIVWALEQWLQGQDQEGERSEH
jgi:predicted transcriptional regulator